MHRKSKRNHIWNAGNQILVDNNFIFLYYAGLKSDKKVFINRYGENYDIDYIIDMM